MHVFRPLYIVLALVGLILIARTMVVPKDFGVHESGYMYGWYRKTNEGEWKDFKPNISGKNIAWIVMPSGSNRFVLPGIISSSVKTAMDRVVEHPSDPPKLNLDRTRDLCLRCHTFLAYPTSKRSEIKGIDPGQHNPGGECAGCHEPHVASKPG